MFRTKGTLFVRQVPSRNGPFCVGELQTEEGEFRVKDPLLDQFAPGEYRGTFWIEQIYLAQYMNYGRSITELRARLHEVEVDTERGDARPRPSASDEPDPIDEATSLRAVQPEPLSSAFDAGQASAQLDDQIGHHEGNQDLALFGQETHEQISNGLNVKLDPAIDDRSRFRAQTTRLKQLGYSFHAKLQLWKPKA